MKKKHLKKNCKHLVLFFLSSFQLPMWTRSDPPPAAESLTHRRTRSARYGQCLHQRNQRHDTGREGVHICLLCDGRGIGAGRQFQTRFIQDGVEKCQVYARIYWTWVGGWDWGCPVVLCPTLCSRGAQWQEFNSVWQFFTHSSNTAVTWLSKWHQAGDSQSRDAHVCSCFLISNDETTLKQTIPLTVTVNHSLGFHAQVLTTDLQPLITDSLHQEC